jgi:hypothetical protein
MQAILEIEKANQLSIADNLMARKKFQGNTLFSYQNFDFLIYSKAHNFTKDKSTNYNQHAKLSVATLSFLWKGASYLTNLAGKSGTHLLTEIHCLVNLLS